MRIWLIQTGEVLPLSASAKKMRTALLADELLKRGHDILWWTSAFDHFKKEWIFDDGAQTEIKKGLRVMALKGTGYTGNLSLARLLDHRAVAGKFRKFAKNMPKPDIIIASLPSHDLAYEAAGFGNDNNVPVIIDIRDPWPDIFLDYVPWPLKIFARVALFKDFLMAKEAVRTADGLVAVTGSLLNMGLKRAGRTISDKDDVFYLGYKKSSGRACDRFAAAADGLHNKFIVFFVGTISRSYHNPLILLDAAKKISSCSDIHFVIAGDGELFGQLRERAKGLANVTLTGWLDQDEIEFWLKRSAIGVCPAAREADVPTNKMFAYLSAGLPVISGFRGEMKDIIEKYKAGFYYEPGDVDALVASVKRLHDDTGLCKEMSENAGRVFNEMFDAEKIYGAYAEYVERAARRHGQKERMK